MRSLALADSACISKHVADETRSDIFWESMENGVRTANGLTTCLEMLDKYILYPHTNFGMQRRTD